MKAPTAPFEQMRIEQETVICEDRCRIAGKTVYYRLSRADATYGIEVTFQEESCRLELGSSLSEAATFYEALVKGRVTPCSAPFILEDLRG